MEDGKTFYGMSSENEYWYSSTETLADDSSVETLSGKDNRDASCNVDFDEELDEIIDDGTSAVVRSSRRSVNPTRSTISDCVECKSSQYVRWDVLMSLGVGLWAVLCIVDVLHSDKSVTIGWLHESTKEEKNLSKTLTIEKPGSYFRWFANLWPYLWRTMSISNADGGYVLLFLLMILFCASPRIRDSSNRAVVQSSSNSKIHQIRPHDPIVHNKSIGVVKKLPVVIEPAVEPLVPVKFQFRPAICLHARILPSIEGDVASALVKLKNESQFNFGAQFGVPAGPAILDARSQTECRKPLGVERGLLARLDVAGYGTFNFVNIGGLDRRSIATIYPTHSNNRISTIRTFHLRIDEHMRTRKKYSTDVYGDWFASARRPEPAGESTESSKPEKNKSRIITSSPAFKKFLLSLKCNDPAPLALATTSQVFRTHLHDI